ncbi:MAG: 2-phospho-L-lactate guanylyltransferase [Betaproteobacteria bacterium RIFCSPLOWO2_12_FULL_65_14]|nr:MAG: 2-phospho-L-lactate guanylyltransferase [Betaproteobacteria bacterium RIFCSPLOWO2_12_FULL_65_14]
MKIFALIPVKDPNLGKSRLTSVLSDGQRHSLNLQLALQTIEASIACFGAERTVIVTSSSAVGQLGAMRTTIVLEGAQPAGLNAALTTAASHAINAGAEGLMVVPTDLPRVSAARLAAVASALSDAPVCVLVPDGRGRGTNVFALAPARADLFWFGADSLQNHAEHARSLGYEVRIHACEALGMDIDLPADLTAWCTSQSA